LSLAVLGLLVMVALPIAIAGRLHERRRIGWRIFFIGAGTFIASQIAHIPFNALVLPRLSSWLGQELSDYRLVLVSIFLGLSAGLFEELARYIMYRYWAREVRGWGGAMMAGAGHGGVEALFVAVTVAITVGTFSLAAFDRPLPMGEQQVALLKIYADGFFGARWFDVLLPAVERVAAILLHLSLSLAVFYSVTRKQVGWLLLAILWHTTVNAVGVGLAQSGRVYMAEAAIALMGLLSLAWIWSQRRPEPPFSDSTEEVELRPIERLQLSADSEAIERSRYI